MRFSWSAKASTSCSFFEITCRALSNSTSLFWLFIYGTLFECAAQLFTGTRYQLHFELSVLLVYLFLEGGQMLLFRSQCLLILHESALYLSHAFELCLAFTPQSIVFEFQLRQVCLTGVSGIIMQEEKGIPLPVDSFRPMP